MSEYIPTTEQIRDNYVEGMNAFYGERGASEYADQFSRWLAAHDDEVRAGLVAEEPEREYGLYDPATNDVDGCGTDPVTRESFTGVDWDATGEYIVHRRVAGPWVPVHG